MIWETIVSYARRFWHHPTLKRDVAFVLALLFVYRVANQVPIPGIDVSGLRQFFERNELLGLLNVVAGGGLSNFSLMMLGVGPFITASIVTQLLTMIIPSWEEMSQEGEQGQRKIAQYTRLLTVPLAVIQAYGLINYLQSQTSVLGAFTWQQWVITLVTVTAGTIFLMWLGELISERKIGNGTSLIIFAGIVATFPQNVQRTLAVLNPGDWVSLAIFALIGLVTIVAVVVMNDAQRNLPVHYPRLGASAKANNFLPLKLNAAGVIPIIFAISVMMFPSVIAQFLLTAKNATIVAVSQKVIELYQDKIFYGALYFAMVIIFTYFYTSVVFQPKKMSENLQRQGAFIPGVRPGNHTIEFLESTMYKLTLAGSIFLGLLAVLPYIAQPLTGIATLGLGGTSLLIVVSVVIDTAKKIQGKMVTLDYERL